MSELIQHEHRGLSVAIAARNPVFLRQIQETCADGFGRSDFDPRDSSAHVRGDYLTTIRAEDRSVAGFLTAKFGRSERMLPGVNLGDLEGQDVAYLFGTAVKKGYKHNGLYKKMLRSFLNETMTRGLSTTLFATQNSSIEVGFQRVLEDMQREGKIVTFERLERIKLPGRYGRLLTGELPAPVADTEVQEAYNGLQRENGDAFGVSYRLTYPASGPGRRGYDLSGVFGPSW